MSVAALLHELRKAVGDGQGGVDEAVDAVGQAGLGPGVELGAGLVHALLPAGLHEGVDLEGGAKRGKVGLWGGLTLTP